jgi:hypothetical protein
LNGVRDVVGFWSRFGDGLSLKFITSPFFCDEKVFHN